MLDGGDAEFSTALTERGSQAGCERITHYQVEDHPAALQLAAHWMQQHTLIPQ
jgi:hypothetical protein